GAGRRWIQPKLQAVGQGRIGLELLARGRGALVEDARVVLAAPSPREDPRAVGKGIHVIQRSRVSRTHGTAQPVEAQRAPVLARGPGGAVQEGADVAVPRRVGGDGPAPFVEGIGGDELARLGCRRGGRSYARHAERQEDPSRAPIEAPRVDRLPPRDQPGPGETPVATAPFVGTTI